MAMTMSQYGEELDYYTSLIAFLDDHVACLDVLIEMHDKEYYEEGENE